MYRNRYKKNKSFFKKLKKFLLTILLVFILCVISYGVYKLFLIPPPILKGIEEFRYLSAKKKIALKGKNIKSIEITLRQGSKVITLLKKHPQKRKFTYELEIIPKKKGLYDGEAKIEIIVKSGLIKSKHYEIDTVIDTVAPHIIIVSAPKVVKQGQTAAALVKVKEAEKVFFKIKEKFFKTFAWKKAEENKLFKSYIIIFPVPYNLSKDTVFYVIAEDKAGNKATKSLRTTIKLQKFRSSKIDISDDFIHRVVYSLLNKETSEHPVEDFILINEKWRKRDIEKLYQIGQKSIPKKLWEGGFLQMKNTKVMATYGDRRTYYYKGKPISKSVHLGYDLASIERASVEASNTGIVIYAGELGIYGYTVIIDHGLGVMSLYGHLSKIKVKEGQKVDKGEEIGKTGSTGFAGGDHLHFGILVQGVEVSPIYWWDVKWIENNILNVINENEEEIN